MIVIPCFLTDHAPFLQAALDGMGRSCLVAAHSDEETIRRGLETVNNDTCYASLLAAGQVQRMYAQENCLLTEKEGGEVMVPTTCFSCRSDDACYVVSRALEHAKGKKYQIIDFSNALEQLTLNERRKLAVALCVGDVVLQTKTRIRPRQRKEAVGELDVFFNKWSRHACDLLRSECTFDLPSFLSEFDQAVKQQSFGMSESMPKVGVIGALPAIFCEGINSNLIRTIEQEGCEAVIPYVVPLFEQTLRARRCALEFADELQLCSMILGQNESCFRHTCPSLEYLRGFASSIVPKWANRGAGWTVAAEAEFFAKQGISEIVYVRTFGCLSGHVVGQGIIKQLREVGNKRGDDMTYATIEFDPGTSNINQVNRLKLLTSIAKTKQKK